MTPKCDIGFCIRNNVDLSQGDNRAVAFQEA